MNKVFEKNRLDLAYKRQLTYLNAIMILATIGVLSFLGTFIWNEDNLIDGMILVVSIFIVSYVFYSKVDGNLKNISENIKRL